MDLMGLTAILFPGQGSQSPDMRDTVARVRPDLLEQVLRRVADDPFAHAGESTRFAQPAIFCASLAGWTEMGQPAGDMMAGHSLGELTALVAAEARYGPEAINAPPVRVTSFKPGPGGMMIPDKAVDSCGRVTHFH